MDLDDGGDDASSAVAGVKTSLNVKLSSEGPGLFRLEHSPSRSPSHTAIAGSWGIPSEGRTDVHAGVGIEWGDGPEPSKLSSSGGARNACVGFSGRDFRSHFTPAWMLANDTAPSRVELYRVSDSESKEPLTCLQKLG